MARLSNTLMKPGQLFGNKHLAEATNPILGGQLGIMPQYKATPSDTPYVPPHAIVLLLEVPLFFNYLPNPEEATSILKAMIERYPVSIEGFDKTVSYSYVDQDIGGGQKISRIVNAELPQASITAQYQEKGNRRTIAEWWRFYGDYGLMDPILKRSRLSSLSYSELPIDQLNDTTSFSIIAIEPDAYMRKPVVTYMVNGCHPKSSGEIKSKRAPTNGLDEVSFSIEFNGYYVESVSVDALAESILKGINRTGMNPDNNELFSEAISADVRAAKGGFLDQVNDIAANA